LRAGTALREEEEEEEEEEKAETAFLIYWNNIYSGAH
jgi:hypothetical protein